MNRESQMEPRFGNKMALSNLNGLIIHDVKTPIPFRGAKTTDSATTSNNEVFTSDYYFFSRQQCAQEPYVPGHQIADDLSISNLVVGQE